MLDRLNYTYSISSLGCIVKNPNISHFTLQHEKIISFSFFFFRVKGRTHSPTNSLKVSLSVSLLFVAIFTVTVTFENVFFFFNYIPSMKNIKMSRKHNPFIDMSEADWVISRIACDTHFTIHIIILNKFRFRVSFFRFYPNKKKKNRTPASSWFAHNSSTENFYSPTPYAAQQHQNW